LSQKLGETSAQNWGEVAPNFVSRFGDRNHCLASFLTHDATISTFDCGQTPPYNRVNWNRFIATHILC